ncbi:M-phase phosphoprotein 6 isoform X1 [Toxorhynchites rutilus septentrionalis]|uniref:M-phase phosphoprotein 6 isoform X1 n=2 Tax=Toxorhynchites rutilus septentrionalis TaxID=329112 RepID=UPI0024797EF8|nr:M-phase phosphoprotein 6 isoform X1 [Toxorhynchites rutilus septentrionalis]
MNSKMNKVKLSKGILEMKFMSRTREKIEKEKDDAEGRALYSNEITDKMMHESSKFVIETSYVPCEDLIEGRVSYGGMNPEIERLMELEKNKDLAAKIEKEQAEAAERQKMRKDVPDEEMAKFYTSVMKTMKKKYDKRQSILPLNIKRMQKPKEDD